jgi:hypothetical protein
MFKIAAVLGLVAGGAGYAVYEYTDWFGGCSGSHTACVQQQQEPVKSPCCQSQQDGSEASASCCEASAKVVVKSACCARGCCAEVTTSPLAVKAALSCDNPCLAGVLVACELCAGSTNANAAAAVAGGAAVTVKAVK